MANIVNWDYEKRCVIDLTEKQKEEEAKAEAISGAKNQVIPQSVEEQSMIEKPIMEKSTEKQIVNAEEKKVYLAQEIMVFLNIGRSRCYAYLEEVYKEQKPFRVIKIGKLFRVPKQSFDNWLNGCG